MDDAVVEIDRRPVERQHLALAHAGVQQQPQRREANDALGLLADQLEQRGIEPLKFTRLEVVLDLPRRARL